MTADAGVEDLPRELAPRVLGVLVRRHGDFAVCEDAVQEALVAAAQHWAKEVVPSNPRSWLVTAASRAVVDAWRSVRARRRDRGPREPWSATRSESVSIVAATSAEVGRSTAPERVRRRATCGAASATNAIGPVTTVTVAVGPTLLTALSTSWSIGRRRARPAGPHAASGG